MGLFQSWSLIQEFECSAETYGSIAGRNNQWPSGCGLTPALAPLAASSANKDIVKKSMEYKRGLIAYFKIRYFPPPLPSIY